MQNVRILQTPISEDTPILEKQYNLKEDIICEWRIRSISDHKIHKVYSIHDSLGARKTDMMFSDFYECLAVIALDDYTYGRCLDFLKIKSEKDEK